MLFTIVQLSKKAVLLLACIFIPFFRTTNVETQRNAEAQTKFIV